MDKGNMLKCRSIVEDESLEGQYAMISAQVSLRKEVPQGYWLQASDDSGKVLVWSKKRLEGDFRVYGRVYKGYLILMEYEHMEQPPKLEEEAPVPKEPQVQEEAISEEDLFQEKPQVQERPKKEKPPKEKQAPEVPTETLSESKSHLVSLGVVGVCSLALGAGAYSLSLTYPIEMKTPVFLMLPIISLLLGLAAYFLIDALDRRFIYTFGFRGHCDFLDKLWHIFIPYILSAFILLFVSPKYIQTGISLEYLFSLQKAFMFALVPIGLGVGYHLIIINEEQELNTKQLLAFGVAPMILFIPLFILYFLVTRTIIG